MLGGKVENNTRAVSYLVRLALAREPLPAEREALYRLLSQELTNLAAAPDEAKKIVGNNCPPNIDEPKLAAWTVVCRAVLNLDEFLTRE